MEDSTVVSRRRLLVATGSVTVAGLAGCVGGDDGSDEGMDETTEMMDDEDGMDETTESMDDGMNDAEPTDPASAPRATIDRFSESAGTLHVRGPDRNLPGPGEPIDFDASFTTQGFGPDGNVVEYYDFDVQPTDPAPIYVFFRDGEDTPVEDQLNVVGTVPGDDGYNDFWRVHQVTVPEDYVANTVTSVSGLMDAGYEITTTDVVKNCPVVPEGSTASKRYGDGTADLVEGWYDGSVVYYFLFEESPLSVADGSVPTSPIYVSFNENPGEDGGGPQSGFLTEDDGVQTHNVLATLPDDESYSPLWNVAVYDNADFASVEDLESATDAEILAAGAATVNCPVVEAP